MLRSSPSASPSAPNTSSSRKATAREPDLLPSSLRTGSAHPVPPRHRPPASPRHGHQGTTPSSGHRPGHWSSVISAIVGPNDIGGDTAVNKVIRQALADKDFSAA